MRRGVRIKPILTAFAVMIAFVLAFVAFILAPLLTAALVAGGMYWYERWSRSRRQPGPRRISGPRSITVVTSEDGAVPERSFGFGSGVGREL